ICRRNFKAKSRTKTKREKWMLFYATDFQSLMYPNFIISKILGIFPYRIKATSFEISKPRYILWTIIFCVICVYELTMLYKLNLSEKIRIDVIKIIWMNFSYLYGLFLAIISYAFSGPRMRLLQTVSDISSKLPQKSYQKLSKLIHAKDVFGSCFHFWLMLTLHFLDSEIMVFGLLETFRVFINFIAFQMDMLYINCVCVLKACFKEINDNLENLGEIVINNIPRWIYHEQRHPLLIKLKALKKQHLMICDTVKMLNMIFSLHLLATIALSFKQIIFYVYFNVIQWQNGISLNRDRIHNVFFISVLIYYFTRLALIVWACETSKNEAIKIGTTIHDVLNSISNIQIKDELNLFSLQILHCDNTFSAKGLTIDATLITMMVSSVSMYLLILIQFLIMAHSCDSKTDAINYTQAI
ncbi:Putative gustatory receptor 28b, partial [Trachymyrmex zeteki]